MKSNLKSGSAEQSWSGIRQFFCDIVELVLAQSGFCLLYAIFILQLEPIPVEDEMDSQVGNTMSIVPSRSVGSWSQHYKSSCQKTGDVDPPISAKLTAPIFGGNFPERASLKPSVLLFDHI